jgi:hypothetical protein
MEVGQGPNWGCSANGKKRKFGIPSLRLMTISFSASNRSLLLCFYRCFPYVPYTYTDALEKLSIQSLRKRRHRLDALFCFLLRCIAALYLALRFWKILAFAFLPAILGTSQCLVFVPPINSVLLLGAPMLSTRWVKISTYLQSERFHTRPPTL